MIFSALAEVQLQPHWNTNNDPAWRHTLNEPVQSEDEAHLSYFK